MGRISRDSVYGIVGLVLVLGFLALPFSSGVVFAQDDYEFAIVPKAVNNPFFNAARLGALKAGEELGVKVNYTGPTQTKVKDQIDVLESLIAKGVDGIALSAVDADAVVPVVNRAVEQGIPVITWDSDIAEDGNRLAFVGTDNYEAGVKAGIAFVHSVKSGKYAVITGTLGADNLNQRIAGFESVLNTFPEGTYTEVKGSPFPSEDDIQQANDYLEDILTSHPDIAGIFMSGGWALFGKSAYEQALGDRMEDVKSGELPIISFDVLPAELELLEEGKVSALVGQRPYDMGYKSIQLLHQVVVEGKELEKGYYPTALPVAFQSNVEEFVEHSERVYQLPE
jgi:ribose transport system substrate-binding protein